MRVDDVAPALAAAIEAAQAAGLDAATGDVLQDSNRLVLRLLPCDVVARVAPAGHETMQLELDVARKLLHVGAPVAGPDQRVPPVVHTAADHLVTFWRHHEPVAPRELDPQLYARTLEQLHAGLRSVDHPSAPHFTERVAKAVALLTEPERTPAMADADRELLHDVIAELTSVVLDRTGDDQLLHGEPHGDNVLRTADGLLFTDFETVCHGPVEFDVADVPEEVATHYRGLDQHVLRSCRTLVLAMVATWCWAGYDDHENLRTWAPKLLAEVREAAAR